MSAAEPFSKSPNLTTRIGQDEARRARGFEIFDRRDWC